MLLTESTRVYELKLLYKCMSKCSGQRHGCQRPVIVLLQKQ